MNDEAYERLIDRNLIEAAQGKLDAVIARRGPAQVALATAQTGHKTAQRAYNDALSGASGVDPHAARQALDDAARKLDTAKAVGPAVDGAISMAELDLKTATGKAMAPVLAAGILARLAAAKRADAARCELVAAQADHKAATAVIKRSGGCHHGMDRSSVSLTRHDGQYETPTYAEDIGLFSDPLGYFPGLNADGTVKSAS